MRYARHIDLVGKIFAENFGSEDCFKLSHGRPTNK
jgi:hypothetical protein